MSISRIHEDPRVTKPYSDQEWQRIEAVGRDVDRRLQAGDVRLTMGGEPTFVSIDDMDGAEWTTAAVGPTKRRLAAELLERLQRRFAPESLLHFGQGKWYPGAQLPRWAFSCFWRGDGEPIWTEPSLVAREDKNYGHTTADAQCFVETLAETLGVESSHAVAAYEDVWHYIAKERRLPLNVDLPDSKLKDPQERARLARIAERGLGEIAGYVLPLRRQWWQAQARWLSSPWPVRSERMFLLPGDSPLGLRLPLDSLPWSPPPVARDFFVADPSIPREALPPHPGHRPQPEIPAAEPALESAAPRRSDDVAVSTAGKVVRTALCVEPRDGKLHVFMPPTERLEDYLDLIAAIEATAKQTDLPIVLEGYLPPTDHRLHHIKVTPDPGVIEVNTHPAGNWDELVEATTALYEEAYFSRLATEKFDLDGATYGNRRWKPRRTGRPIAARKPVC